jgi:hypothetical protein
MRHGGLRRNILVFMCENWEGGFNLPLGSQKGLRWIKMNQDDEKVW